MKFFEIQGLDRQPSIIQTRLFVWQKEYPQSIVESAGKQKAKLPGWKMKNNRPIDTGDWQDNIKGTLLTNLEPEMITEMRQQTKNKEVVVVPVIVEMVRIEAQMLI